MLLSETDAKTKECRQGGTTPVAASLPEPVDYRFLPIQFPMCAASGCMHWRWGESIYEGDPAACDQNDKPDGEGWVWMHVTTDNSLMGKFRWCRVKATRGYCGLAGKP